MALTRNAHTASYELISPGNDVNERTARPDEKGLLNTIAAWWLFPAHLSLCALLVTIIIVWLDGRKFHTGAPEEFFKASSGLYQTQVNAFLSLALVCIRLIGGCCTTLLIWRVIHILLEKRGISLLEITRLNSWRVPVNPIGRSVRDILWSIWALWAIMLLWPPSFSSPLASSSVAWAPSTRIGQQIAQIEVQDMDHAISSQWFSRVDNRHLIAVSAAAMAAADPSYVSGDSGAYGAGHTRRFFKGRLPVGSVMGAPAPYIDISLKWVNASDVPHNDFIGKPAYTDVNTNGFILDRYGTIAILRDTAANDMVEVPTAASIFTGKKYIWIRLESIYPGQRMGDGSNASSETMCPTTSPYFGNLPDVEQYRFMWISQDSSRAWVSFDCYIMAEAAVTAGRQSATGCQVSSFDTSEQYATCAATQDTPGVEEDWLTDLSLAFMSEVLKFTVMQNLTLPLLTNHSIDDYAIATLRLGYHASWNVLTKLLSNTTVSATYFGAESVVQAQINRPRLFGWLGMNATLALSALLVCLAQLVTAVKTVRDPTLAALTIDINEVTHSGRTTEGLCNAVTLSKKDKKLPRMMWDRHDHGKSPNRNASRREMMTHVTRPIVVTAEWSLWAGSTANMMHNPTLGLEYGKDSCVQCCCRRDQPCLVIFDLILQFLSLCFGPPY